MDDPTNSTSAAANATPSLNGSFVDDPCVIRDGAPNQKDLLNFIIYGVLVNSVSILGLIGNVLSITILSRPNMRSSINCCLVGLASFDTILLTTSLLMFGIPAIPEYTGTIMWYQKDVFPWIALVAYPLGIIAQTGSVYLTVTVTIERYVAVCHPLKARSLCTYGRAKIYVISVAVFSILYNMPRFWELTYQYCEDEMDGYFPTLVMTEMRKKDNYIQIYITWLYLVVMYLVPFLSLLVFNLFIYKQIRRCREFGMKRMRACSTDGEVRLANHERQQLSRLQKKELGLAVMLLCVVIVFFICNILAFIVSVLEMFSITIYILTMINNLLVTVNSSVNFIIYCIFGQKFRRLFFEIFCFGALNAYKIPDGPPIEFATGGSYMYGADRRYMSNGRTTQHTRSIRLSSWNSSQIHRTSGTPGTWQARSMSLVANPHLQYSNVPLLANPSRKSGTIITNANSPSVISPSSDPLVENDEKSDIV